MSEQEAQFVCDKCGKATEKLYGFMWRQKTWCKACYEAAVEAEQQAGRVCGICGTIQKNCCC